MVTRKFKVTLRDNVVTKWYWKKSFLFFGYWIPYHNIISSNQEYGNNFINEIDNYIKSLYKK